MCLVFWVMSSSNVRGDNYSLIGDQNIAMMAVAVLSLSIMAKKENCSSCSTGIARSC